MSLCTWSLPIVTFNLQKQHHGWSVLKFSWYADYRDRGDDTSCLDVPTLRQVECIQPIRVPTANYRILRVRTPLSSPSTLWKSQNIHLNYDWNYILILGRASGIVLDDDRRLLWTMTRYKEYKKTALDYERARIDLRCASAPDVTQKIRVPSFNPFSFFWNHRYRYF